MREKAMVYFWHTDSSGVVCFGVPSEGNFTLGDERSKSYCWNMSVIFEGLENTMLTGKTGFKPEGRHHCARLVAVQLE